MMTKPIWAKELHYPVIQFLIISIIVFFWEGGLAGGGGNHTGTCRVTCQAWMKDVDVYSDALQVFVLSEVEKLSFILNLFQNNVALVILAMLIFFSHETLVSQKMRWGL